ncbi:hypothetical protein [Streptomyces sp. NPDC048508]|uniref:hypothetical protein n=1 Tax=Streptomyces sp. NPDC048508 TaxID=3365561 RepID=UPI003720B3F0
MTEASESAESDQLRSGQGEPPESRLGSRVSTTESMMGALSAIGAFALSALNSVINIPEGFRPWMIAALGVIAAFVVFRTIRNSQSDGSPATAPVRRIAFQALAPIAALTCLTFIWSLPGIAGSEKSKMESKASADARWAKVIARLRQGIKPSHHAATGCTIAVSGTGWVPDHFDIWTAVLNGTNEDFDTSRLFDLERATVSGKSWTTAKFRVGAPKPKNDHYWIFVYLVHEDASSILTNAVIPEGSQKVSLHRPIEHATLVDQIPVERAAQANC